MATPFIAEIRMFGGTFAPRQYAFCNGQLISIAQNTALFALIGTTYGGNGTTTFGLPDLRGRVPVHQGQGPGLSNYVLGQQSGVENVTLQTSQIPAHNHTASGLAAPGNQTSPGGATWATISAGRNPLPLYSNQGGVLMNTTAVGATGGGQPHENMKPFLAITFIIALQGIFPSRN